ncbi:hypothetical protein ACET3Z_013846 [Daucus carota]
MTDEEEGDAEEDNNRPKRQPIFERDLTPEQRDIPDTELLHRLGYHLSAYARAGLGPPTQNLNYRGAWRIAIELYNEANDQYKELFNAAGFEDFLKIKPVDVPVAYNLALTERWFSETNTLHLPCCEIGATPVDWTMITGLRFEGHRIKFSSKFTIERALDLLGKPEAKRDGKINLKSIKPEPEEIRDEPATYDEKKKIFRRLFLYVVGSCFFNNNRSVISHHFVKFLIRIHEVGSYDWGSITFATFLAGMRRKVTGEIGALTGFWQFLPFWAFEYLDVSRPEHHDADVFPRARRWICPKGSTNNESTQFLANRCKLNFVEESQVTWQPYLSSAIYGSDVLMYSLFLSKRRVPFQGIGTWEYYLGERCRRQLGFRCQVPNDPPQMMHGPKDRPEDVRAVTLVKVGLDYASWFANNSIGNILNVTRSLGGPEIAGKVIDQWLAKHQPNLILVEQSQYEKIKEDRNALEEECAKLREELSRARGKSTDV